MSVPKLRFKEFGGDWSESKLKDCIDSIDSGWSPQCESYPANENEWAVLKTTSVDWDGFKANFNKKLPSNLEAKFEIEVKPNDILVTRAGPTERVGVVAVVPQKVRSKLMISDKLIRLKANSDNSPEFLGISLSSLKCQNQLQSKTSGLAKSQTNISQKILSDVSLITPAKPEQTKIASFLSAVDEKISQLTQKHELLSQYKQGMMQKLFSQQIRFKADNGSEFGEWEEKELHQIFQIKAGGDIEKSSVSEVRTSEFSYPIFANSDKNKGFYGWANKFKYKEAVTVTGRGNLGIAVARNEPFYPIVRLLVLLPLVKQNLKFFEEQINLLDIVSESTGVPQLTAPQLSEYKVNVPSLEEQTKIANFTSAIDQKIEVVVQQIEQAKQWKKGLLQQMFV